MSWGREKASDENSSPRISRNHHIEFEYDFADIPFSPPTRNAGYLESGLPFWKTNISDSDKYHFTPDRSGSDSFSSILKFPASNSRSNENVTSNSNSGQHRPLITQSLPTSPLSTPCPTPLTTPVPTPQTSPSLNRKVEMEAVCKIATQVTQDQLPSNARWFYLGFRSVQIPQEMANNDEFSRNSDLSGFGNASKAQEFRPLSYLQKRALAISNRDMNFLAPTSM